jgi:hypothetical protein
MITQSFQVHRNWFAALFSPLSWALTDASTGQESYFFKMKLNGLAQIWNSREMNTVLIEMKRKPLTLSHWELFEEGRKVGDFKSNLAQNVVSFGMEHWTVFDESGKECFSLEPQEKGLGAAAKQALDNVTILFNPTRSYVFLNKKGECLARLSAKHAAFSGTYQLDLLGKDKTAHRFALGLFAVMISSLRK